MLAGLRFRLKFTHLTVFVVLVVNPRGIDLLYVSTGSTCIGAFKLMTFSIERR